jgi:hypothetical protein
MKYKGALQDWAFCPYCGHDLSQPMFADVQTAIASLANSSVPLRICFDVDGVLCKDDNRELPYGERAPYEWVASTLLLLKEAGHTLVLNTARYMAKCHGDAEKASRGGWYEAMTWLKFHGIPFDELYLGKPSAHIYVDDRACRVNSNSGITDWVKTFYQTLKKTMSAKVSK